MAKGKSKDSAAAGHKVIAVNKKARFNYHIDETFEAGMVLTGGEIKSIRVGKINLEESYIVVRNSELFLMQAHISPYQFDTNTGYDPTRKRKLLMHKHEIDRLRGKVEAKGFTLVPTKLYLKRGRAKLELALAKGKAAPDKRDSIRDREAKREAERAMKLRR